MSIKLSKIIYLFFFSSSVRGKFTGVLCSRLSCLKVDLPPSFVTGDPLVDTEGTSRRSQLPY